MLCLASSRSIGFLLVIVRLFFFSLATYDLFTRRFETKCKSNSTLFVCEERFYFTPRRCYTENNKDLVRLKDCICVKSLAT